MLEYSTIYLYNCEPSEFANLPYREALQYKLDKANELIYELTKPSYIDIDDERISAVLNAIKLCEGLLDELK